MDQDEVETSSGKTLGEHIAGLRYRKSLIAAVATAVACLSVIVALALPATYRASATVLVRDSEVPQELVRSTVTSFADERLQVIGQQIMTRPVLLGIVEKFDLYKDARKRPTTDEVVTRMRRDISVAPVEANISERSTGRRVNTTIAFRIAYEAPEATVAKEVVEDLVSLYLKENVKAREESMSVTSAFLDQQVEQAAQHLQRIDAEVAAFRHRNYNQLPGSDIYTAQVADRLVAEIHQTEREIGFARDRQVGMETRLSFTKRNVRDLTVITTPSGERTVASTSGAAAERLRILQAQYAAAETQYQPVHPDMMRLKREIEILRGEIATTEKAEKKDNNGAVTETAAGRKPTEANPDNPEYLVLDAWLESNKREIEMLTKHRENLIARQRGVDGRLRTMPEVEREYRDLVREQESAKDRFRELKAKQAQADGARQLEREHHGERFTLLEAVTAPERPVRPNRMLIVLGGLIGGLLAGLTAAWLRESFDRSVKGPLELARTTTLPIFSSIAYIETRADRKFADRRFKLALFGYAVFFIGVLALIHLGVRPVPEILASAFRRV